MSFDLFKNRTDVSSEEFTSSGTFTVPAGVYLVWVTGVGGGGAGGGADNGTSTYGGGGAGGGSGEHAFRHPVHVTPGENISVTIGAGGSGGTVGTSPTAGSAGGATLFGTKLKLRGGGGGEEGYNTSSSSTTTLSRRNGAGGGVGGGRLMDQAVVPDQDWPWRQIAGIGTICGGADGGRVYSNNSLNGSGFGANTGGTGGTGKRGGGGGASFYGSGGAGGQGSYGAVGDGAGYGAGGGGGGVYHYLGSYTGNDGGDGYQGYLKVEWFA